MDVIRLFNIVAPCVNATNTDKQTGELLEQADCLVYDALASPAMLAWLKPGCEKIYVGKRAGNHALPQEEINALLVQCSSRYGCTVRLKGGDPYVFGRGGEEAAALQAASVPLKMQRIILLSDAKDSAQAQP